MTADSSSRFLIATLLAAFAALCILFAPYLAAFVLAIVLGVLFEPVNVTLRKTFGPSGAALVTVVLIVLAIAGPVAFVITQVAKEAGHILTGLQTGTVMPDTFITLVQAKIDALFPMAHLDVLASFKSALAWLVQQAGSVFQSVAGIVLNLFLSVMALFYWFKDSHRFRVEALRVIPLSQKDAEGILSRLSQFIHSLIKGTLVVAVLQGVTAGIGFVIFGIPNPFLWASVTMICALIPTIGTTIIFVPMIGYLFFSGDTVSAVGLTLWGLGAVGMIDNLLGPRLMSRGTNMHPLFTLMAVLGGVKLLGPIGIFAGPLIVSLFFAVCKTYTSRYEHAD
jgi:predicted PurR-regulated permease PerM